MRARIFKILHGLDPRPVLQDTKQLMQLNELFHTHLEFFAKGVRKRRDCKRSVCNFHDKWESCCVSRPDCAKIKTFTSASREHRKSLLHRNRRHCPFNFLRELLYQHQFNEFDWLLMTI